MRKLLYISMLAVLCTGCFKSKTSSQENDKSDSVYVCGDGYNRYIPLDSFLMIKDSLVYDSMEYNEPCWFTKEHHWFLFECPDTITVAFTRNGKFEDSVKAVRQGLVSDSTGKYYSPAYVFGGVVGDNWTYDINGKFIEFNCVDLPHSGAPHHYKP